MITSSYKNTLETEHSIKSRHKVTMEWNYNSFIPVINSGCYKTDYNTAYQSNNSSGYYDDGVSVKIFDGGGSNITLPDNTRKKYTPLSSMFEPNRPDPGIIHLTSYRKGAQVIGNENLTVKNFGNAASGNRKDRAYPIYKNSSFRYWNSVRRIANGSTVGVSGSGGTITYAAPFAVYAESFFVNKIVIKTQKYQGHPVDFKVEYLLDGGTTWTQAYAQSDSSALNDGIIEIYYNGSTWGLTPQAVTTFIGTPSNAIKIRGIRFSVTKMNLVSVPLEVIEISPRLICDLSEHVISFDKDSSINTSQYGLPISGISSATGMLRVSNFDRFFASRNSSSILSNFMVRGVETKLYQVIQEGAGAEESIPLGTMYAESWSENTDFTVDIRLEDYFIFLKSMKAPDISIANISGIEASVALLILLDNAGVTNYNFNKLSSTSLDDYVIEYFFSDSSRTVLEVIEDIAISAQLAIYVDANNIIQAVTKEKLLETVSPENTDMWMIASEDYASKTENSYISGKIANVRSLSETVINPITDLTIRYKGNGIQREAIALIKTPELFKDENNVPFYNASVISRELSYVNTELWSVDSSEDGSDRVLISIPYIQDISAPETKPAIITTASSSNNFLKANSENDLIRTIYANATADDKKYFEIVLDAERATEFLKSNKFSGYFTVDSELIKCNGMVVDLFDPRNTDKTVRKKVVFNEGELSSLVAQSSSGSSVICYSILVDLNYKIKDRTAAISNNDKEYEFVDDGRAQESTLLSAHSSQTSTVFTNNIFRVKFLDSSVPSYKPIGTISSKSVNKLNPLNTKSAEKTVSYPGYFKISGPKNVFTKSQSPAIPSGTATSITKLLPPIDNLGERFITGFYKTLSFVPHKISTRMRLLSKPDKSLFTGNTKDVPNYHVENRGIAGIAFNLSVESGGTTGYFIEIEDIGNITAEQLADKAYENLRFYKIYKSGANFIPKVLAKAWVNVSAVSGESIDFGQSMINEGRSYAGTSDLSVIKTIKNGKMTFDIYWETQKVCSYSEPVASITNKNSKVVGMFVRSDSEAMFDYFLSSAVSKNQNYKPSQFFLDIGETMKIDEAAERGYLPPLVSKSMVGDNSSIIDLEDFGRQIREAKKFDVRFDAPSISANMISLTKLNKDYAVKNFSFSSYGAEFWVFNTSRASIGLSMDKSTPLIISGIEINSISPGEISLKKYISNYMGDGSTVANILEENTRKYGEVSASLESTFINSLPQAENFLRWAINSLDKQKKELSIECFANPLLEIGDKVRVFYTAVEHEMSKIIDTVYYVTSIRYSVDGAGPTMTVAVREI